MQLEGFFFCNILALIGPCVDAQVGSSFKLSPMMCVTCLGRALSSVLFEKLILKSMMFDSSVTVYESSLFSHE